MDNYIPQQGDFCGIIYLSKNGRKHKDKYIAMVDMDDYERINQYEWYYHNGGYAFRREDGKNIMMHNEILQTSPGFTLEHKDSTQKRNNTKSNLRSATRTEQNRNRCVSAANTSGYKGVVFRRARNKYYARIHVDGKPIYLGQFESKHDAARAYNEAAIRYFGEFAVLNEILSG